MQKEKGVILTHQFEQIYYLPPPKGIQHESTPIFQATSQD